MAQIISYMLRLKEQELKLTLVLFLRFLFQIAYLFNYFNGTFNHYQQLSKQFKINICHNLKFKIYY